MPESFPTATIGPEQVLCPETITEAIEAYKAALRAYRNAPAEDRARLSEARQAWRDRGRSLARLLRLWGRPAEHDGHLYRAYGPAEGESFEVVPLAPGGAPN